MPPRDARRRARCTMHEGFRFAVYASAAAAPPELDRDDVLEWIGRFLGRMHAVGAQRALRASARARHRHVRRASRATFLLAHGSCPPTCARRGRRRRALALDGVRRAYERAGDVRGAAPARRLPRRQRAVDADERGPHFVDFDDARTGPGDPGPVDAAVGRPRVDGGAAREGAGRLRALPRASTARELALVEALRTLRLLHYSAWIAQRWDDPAFPAAFPWFGTTRYWQDRILELREQIAAMDEPPLAAR